MENTSEEPIDINKETLSQDVNIHTITRIIQGAIRRGYRTLSGILSHIDTNMILHIISYSTLCIIILQQLFEDKKQKQEIERLRNISKV